MLPIPELLAPAGSLECVRAAVGAGADAVYFGGKAFNARAGAANLSLDEIREAVSYAHLYGVRCYLTLNILVKEREWDELTDYVLSLKDTGIDAFIVQDLGVAALLRRLFPEAELHASTQMAVHNADGALLLKELGFSRAVLARELSLSEIREIREKAGIELEVFAHGALCCAYSGRCYLSSFHGGRSGNRGQCAGACRLPYRSAGQSAYPMNLKDLCAAGLLSALAEAGAGSLKLEGRMKGAAYVAGVTSVYRKLLDAYAESGLAPSLSGEDRFMLEQLFNRGAFTEGYLKNDKRDMLAPDTPKHQGVRIGTVKSIRGGLVSVRPERSLSPGDVLELRPEDGQSEAYPTVRVAASMLRDGRLEFKIKEHIPAGTPVYRLVDTALNESLSAFAARAPFLPLEMSACLRVGQPAVVSVRSGRTAVSEQGALVQAAASRPLSEEDVARALRKTGGSPFTLEAFSLALDEGAFMPVSQLNALRRKALEALAEALREDTASLKKPGSFALISEKPSAPAASLTVAVDSAEQWRAVLASGLPSGSVILPISVLTEPELIRASRDKGIVLCVRLKAIARQKALPAEEKQIRFFLEQGVTSFEAEELGQLMRLRRLRAEQPELHIQAGYHLGVMNREAAAALRELGAERFFVSAELGREEREPLAGFPGASVYAYGMLPLMLTEQCFAAQTEGCRKNAGGNRGFLTDRTGARLPYQTDCSLCLNTLYDEKPLYIGDRGLAGFSPRLAFTLEDASRTAEVLDSFARGAALAGSQRGHELTKLL